MMRNPYLLTGCAALLMSMLWSTAALGQGEAAPEDQDMNTLRVGIPSDRDNPMVDAWINVQLGKLRTSLSNPILIPEGIKSFRASFDAQYNHANNTGDFKKKLAERIGAVFALEYAKGQQLEEVVGQAMARVVLDVRSLDAREAIFAGLTAADEVVRYLSAQTLIKLQPDISADNAATTEVLQKLQAAAPAAGNGVVAAQFYQAAALNGQIADAVAALVAIMDGRLALMRQGPAALDRGEVPAIAFFDQAEQAGKLTPELRVQVVQRLAPLLRMHTERYAQPNNSAEEGWAMEETILATESLLKKMTKPEKSPDITRELQSGGANSALNMQIELIQWIGSDQVSGVVNKAPWGVPAGAP